MAVPLALLTAQDEAAPGLRLESSVTGPAAPPELVVSLEDPAVNEAATTSGARTVRLECLDTPGRVVVRKIHPWPFPKDATSPLPHVHQRLSGEQLEVVARCRLQGTKPPLEGALSASGI